MARRGSSRRWTGYSIGRWIDEDGDGRYDVLEVETRGFKGPRHYDASGLPLHHDNQSIFKERFYLDKKNRNVLHDQITVFRSRADPAVDRRALICGRNANPQPNWGEFVCQEGNAYVDDRQGVVFHGRRRPADADAGRTSRRPIRGDFTHLGQ